MLQLTLVATLLIIQLSSLLPLCASTYTGRRRQQRSHFAGEDDSFVTLGSWGIPSRSDVDDAEDQFTSHSRRWLQVERPLVQPVSTAVTTTTAVTASTAVAASATATTTTTTSTLSNNSNKIFTQILSHLHRQTQEHLSKLKLPFQDRFSRLPGMPSDTLMESTAENVDLARRLHGMTMPIIPTDVWNDCTGHEFQDCPEAVDRLTDMGYSIVETMPGDGNPWIEWKPFGSNNNSGSSSSISSSTTNGHSNNMQQQQQQQSQSAAEEYDDNIQVWTGKSKCDGMGSQVPWIKTRSIVSGMTPTELMELLMDSTRIKTYNPWSLGRIDCWVAPEPRELSQTKIVKNRTQPPLGSQPVVAVTLLHARALHAGAWIVVSRAIGGTRFFDDLDDNNKNHGRSDILLGVNLLEPIRHDSCRVTAVTHMYSPMVPLLLAERVGVKSAIKFVKDIRAVVVPAGTR